MVVFIQTLWTQCPILGATLSILSTHQRQSKPLEQAIISRSAILCSCESPAICAILMKIDLSACRDWAKTGRWSGWFALHQGSVQKCVSVHAFLLCLSLSVSHTVGYRLGLLWLFPKPNSLCGFCIVVGQPQDSDLLTMSPTRLSVNCTKDRLGSWPWHPESKRADVGIQHPPRV